MPAQNYLITQNPVGTIFNFQVAGATARVNALIR